MLLRMPILGVICADDEYSDLNMSEKSQNMKETFVIFKQHSMDFIQSDTKSQSRIRHALEDQNELHLQFAIYHTVRTLLLEFRQALKYNGFKCIEMGDRQLLIIRSKFMDRFKMLFLCKQPPKFILTITTHEFLSVRTVSIKPLKSNSAFAQVTDLSELSQQVNHIGQLLLGLKSLNEGSSALINELDSEYKQDFYSLDATSYYMFSKMLVDSNYSLGQKILTVLNRFQSISKIQNCSKEDHYWLHEALNEISNDLLQGFNCSRKELLQILAYCRKSVQQYFYNIHHQSQANIGRVVAYETSQYSEELRTLQRSLPETLKQLLKLQRMTTSMDIFKSFFTFNIIFRAEIQVKNMDEQQSSKALSIIRHCFSGIVSEKSRLLKHFGYDQQQYQPYIKQFNFDHEVTF